jgi:hypothetical protein
VQLVVIVKSLRIALIGLVAGLVLAGCASKSKPAAAPAEPATAVPADESGEKTDEEADGNAAPAGGAPDTGTQADPDGGGE